MTHRGQQVWHLLRAYVAWVPGPKPAARAAQPGEVAAKPVRCPACNGAKIRRIRAIEQPCDRCRDPRPNAKTFGQPIGKIFVDPQTMKPPATPEDREAQRLTGSERSRWEGIVDSQLRQIEEGDADALSKAIDRQIENRPEVYAHLDRALAWLRGRHHTAYELVWSALIYAPFGEPEGQLRRVCEVICEMLATRMPQSFSVPRSALEMAEWTDRKESLWRGRGTQNQEKRNERSDEVVRLRAEGMTQVAIARQLGLSQPHVHRILNAAAEGVATVAA